MDYACPRCQIKLFDTLDEEAKWVPCPSCFYEFSPWDFKTHARRQQVAAHRCVILPDQLMGTTQRGAPISLKDRIFKVLGVPKSANRIEFANCAHELIKAASGLGLLYPAIPRTIPAGNNGAEFWVDSSHASALKNVKALAADLSELYEFSIRKGFLTKGEVRHAIDAMLPHANWNGRSVTYSTWKPEIRGLLLSIKLLEAKQNELPKILKDIRFWIREDGWDEWGNSTG
jgi:hypothetical protein